MNLGTIFMVSGCGNSRTFLEARMPEKAFMMKFDIWTLPQTKTKTKRNISTEWDWRTKTQIDQPDTLSRGPQFAGSLNQIFLIKHRTAFAYNDSFPAAGTNWIKLIFHLRFRRRRSSSAAGSETTNLGNEKGHVKRRTFLSDSTALIVGGKPSEKS